MGISSIRVVLEGAGEIQATRPVFSWA